MSLGKDKIKWGILGTGKISAKFAHDLSIVEDAQLLAVASRTPEKGIAFAEKHNALRSYASYHEMLQDPEIDIVYIGTPHSFHKAHSVLCMENGKAVLCEKPATLNSKELRDVLEVSKRKKTFYMEALWTRFLPAITQLLEIIESNELGKIDHVEAEFCFEAPVDLKSRLYDMNLGAGSIMDIGIYPVFLAYLLLGIPERIEASGQVHSSGADQTATIRFFYPDGQLAVLHSSIVYGSQMPARITMTKGYILIQPRWHESAELTILKAGYEPKAIACKPNGKGYTHEIDECHRCLRTGQIQSQIWSHQNSLDLMALLDEIRLQVGVRYSVD
ncbi:MAG: Gfo/Idh/MocA family oxidoreductase [Saprospiraceae bacterium]|nr:Gfo/Idh/MocA family oxidoreductase [Saprospiraceae bacterium]